MISKGSQVTFHYRLTVDGEELDTSRGSTPLAYTHGERQIVPGLESELEGLAVGDKRDVVVPPEQGYGVRNESGVQQVPRSAFRDADGLSEGVMVQGQINEQPFQATVVRVSDEAVVLDLNHPLAGKTLHFEIEVMSVA